MLSNRPKLHPHYHLEVVPGHGAFLLSGSEQLVLQGQLYEWVTPLLDGRSVAEICEYLSDRVPAAKVFFTIRKLDARGLIAEAVPEAGSAEAARWSRQRIDPVAAARRLAETTVTVKTAGIDAGEAAGFRALLAASAVQLADQGALTVVVTSHYLHPELARINRESLHSGQPWMLIKPVGTEVWAGPIFHPGNTGCWECLAARLHCNQPILSCLGHLLGTGTPPASDLARSPAAMTIAWGLAATAVTNWVASDGQISPLNGRIHSFDVISWESRTHSLQKHPACPACGPAAREIAAEIPPLQLQNRKKTYIEDGGHRALSPEETIARYQHHVSPICGEVSVLEPASWENEGVMHVYYSGHNLARGPQNLNGLRGDLRSSSCGKGASDAQAKASALCESLERYSGVFRGNEPRRKARMAALGTAAIHPADCLLFSERQYQQRAERNQRFSVFNYVPRPFDPEQEIEWTPLWSLTQDTVRYLPTSYCYFNYPQEIELASSIGCSNGCAAGNNLEEAILQGFLELVERDSIALWWYNRLRRPGFDLTSIDEPYVRRLQAYLRKYGYTFWVLDLTADLGIPVFAAVARRSGPSEQLMFGFGAHFDPRIALIRSITELNQMLVVLIHEGQGGLPPGLAGTETADWLQQATLEAHPYLKPAEGKLRTMADYPHTPTDDIRDDLLRCQALVEQQGLEMLVLDQTRSEVGLPVVKVVVPGLRHFWARLAPGRLYDVPVKLGWLEKPQTENELNPVAMFL